MKQQFARVFQPSDWRLFRQMADIYLRQAAFLRKSDIEAPPSLKLLARNAQKRLLIGVGVELLLKALYLKNGYAINKPEPENRALKLPFRFKDAAGFQLIDSETFQLGPLIDNVSRVVRFDNEDPVLRGLRIAKVFRNKEGHVVTDQHVFDPSNYNDIELALREVYRQGFNQDLKVRFSLKPNELAFWHLGPNIL